MGIFCCTAEIFECPCREVRFALKNRRRQPGLSGPKSAAGSTGRGNTGLKSLCWGCKWQVLTWRYVGWTSHFVQIGLRVHRQVGALGKVLSQQAISVFIRAALPRALGIAKINVDVGR